ncbi:MAG: hypothetical protein ACJ75J_18410 [Cytophagaceae bacterium]
MWTILELILALSLILVAITEFFYPLIAGKPLFGSFRKSATPLTETATETASQTKNNGKLDEKISEARKKVEEVKTVQNEVTEFYKSAEQLKNESDNLLK